MDLGAYLKSTGETQTAFAKRIGTTQDHVSELTTAKVNPTIATVSKIHEATNGKVSWADWVKTPKRRKKR